MAVVIDSRMTTIGNLVFLKGTMAGNDIFDFKDHVKKIFSFNISPNNFDPSSPPTGTLGMWDYENEQRVNLNILDTPQAFVNGTTINIRGGFTSTYSDSVSFLLIGRR
tara:strand:- start:97 stop:420 length:324 start_codon:yes stop_codon:yes gene_type:complete